LEIGTNLVSLIKSGHVLIFLNHELAQNGLAQAGLDNAIHTGDGDYLFLVDSNLGFNKTDAVVDRNLSYFVDLSNPQNILAMLIIRYSHTIEQETACKHESSYGSGVYHDMQIRCYWNYWRVYTQPGTILTSNNQTPVPGKWLLTGEDWSGDVAVGIGEGNTQVLSGLFVLPTGRTQDLLLQFDLPPEVLKKINNDDIVYNLRLQKQAGLSKYPVVIQVKPPDGTQPKDLPSEWVLEENTGFWVWMGEIYTHQNFSLVFSPPDENKTVDETIPGIESPLLFAISGDL
jgi:hypothetical protein